MAHGGQEGGLGPAGLIGEILRLLQFLNQMTVLGYVQPAADHALCDTGGVLEWLNPVLDPDVLALQLHGIYRGNGLAVIDRLQVVLVQVGSCRKVLIRQFLHGLVQYVLGTQTDALQIAAVAGQHVALNVPEIEGRRHVLCQGLDKAQLFIERFLGLDPALQVEDPEQRQQEQ